VNDYRELFKKFARHVDCDTFGGHDCNCGNERILADIKEEEREELQIEDHLSKLSSFRGLLEYPPHDYS